MRWTDYVQNNLTWCSLLASQPSLIAFRVGAIFDTFTSPANLKRNRIATESSCSLCNKDICSTAHVLSGCSVAMVQGRYTFWHDSVLSELKCTLKSFLDNLKPYKATSCGISFVKEGVIPRKAKKTHTGVLHSASDWMIRCDLNGGNYIFPFAIAVTSLRPDIVFFSIATKHAILCGC